MSPRFEDVRVGEHIPQLEKLVRRSEVKAYANASGDQNPLHQDEAVARKAGFPGIIAHGMFTMAHLVTCLTNWVGDPRALKRMRVQFRSAVFIGDSLVAGGRVLEKDPVTGRIKLDVWVSVDRAGATEYPIKRSTAEIELPKAGPPS
ncbi:MAG: MaoC/PaaZ C-terminal domain-containing protein [Actinomycetota bacterium]